MRTFVKQIDFHEIEVPKEDVERAVVEAALRHINDRNSTVDSTFTPFVQSDNFGGFKVLVKKSAT